MTDQRPTENSWHLDKRVPIALIAALMGQFAVAAWIASAMFKDIENNRNGLKSLGAKVESLDVRAGQTAVQLGRIEEGIKGMRGDISRLLTVIENGRQPYRGGRE